MNSVFVDETRKEGAKTLKIKKNGMIRYLHSKYDPVAEARNWARKQIEKGARDYILFGGGLCYHVKALLDCIDENSSVLVVEPSKEVYEQVKDTDLFQNIFKDSRFSLYCSDGDRNKYGSISEILSRKRIFRLKIISYPSYELAFAEEYQDFLKMINEYIVQQKIDENTINYFAIDHAANILSNLYYSSESVFVMGFREKFKDKIAVVVSAGPSLDKNIDLLKGNEDRLLIISGGRTLKTLLERGIKPHFAVALDPHYFNFLLIKDVLDADVPLVLSFLSNREIARNYEGNRIFLNNTGIDGFGRYFFDRHVDTLAAGGTVATMQMSFAEYIGCKKIALIGQDLAYTGGKVYSDSALWLKKEQDGGNEADLQDSNLIRVRGNIEEYVYTDPVLYGFIRTFENHIKQKKGCKVYNCTEGGAYIEGTEVMPFEEFIETFCEEDSQDYYREIDEIVKSREEKISSSEIEKKIHLLQKDAHSINKLCDEALTVISKNIYSKEENERDMKKLKKIDNKLNRLTSKFNVAHILANNSLKRLGDVEIDESKPFEEQIQDVRKLKRMFYASVKGIYMGFNYIAQEVLEVIFSEISSGGRKENREE